MPIELEYIAIQINATPIQISDIVAKSKDICQDHVSSCTECQEELYSCYVFDENTPILRALCHEDCPEAGPDGNLYITERNIYINMFCCYFPSEWFIQATQLNPGVVITAHNFGFDDDNQVAQFRDGICTYIYTKPSDQCDLNSQTYRRFLELVDNQDWFLINYTQFT